MMDIKSYSLLIRCPCRAAGTPRSCRQVTWIWTEQPRWAKHSVAKLEHSVDWHACWRGGTGLRKHLSITDAMAADGWSDSATLLRCEQHADRTR